MTPVPSLDRFAYFHKFELEAIYYDVFKREVYRFTSDKESPFIIDCGANIGVTIVYFKHLFPKAKILAFEPNPQSAKYLRQNIANFKLDGVEVIRAALAKAEGEDNLQMPRERDTSYEATLKSGFDLGGEEKSIKVPLVRLSKYIDREVDFLKMDIEGGEEDVLTEIEPKLPQVRAITLEYHRESVSLPRISDLLKKYFSKLFVYTDIGEEITLQEAQEKEINRLIIRAVKD